MAGWTYEPGDPFFLLRARTREQNRRQILPSEGSGGVANCKAAKKNSCARRCCWATWVYRRVVPTYNAGVLMSGRFRRDTRSTRSRNYLRSPFSIEEDAAFSRIFDFAIHWKGLLSRLEQIRSRCESRGVNTGLVCLSYLFDWCDIDVAPASGWHFDTFRSARSGRSHTRCPGLDRGVASDVVILIERSPSS